MFFVVISVHVLCRGIALNVKGMLLLLPDLIEWGDEKRFSFSLAHLPRCISYMGLSSLAEARVLGIRIKRKPPPLSHTTYAKIQHTARGRKEMEEGGSRGGARKKAGIASKKYPPPAFLQQNIRRKKFKGFLRRCPLSFFLKC